MNKFITTFIVVVHFFGLIGILFYPDFFLPFSFLSIAICSLGLLFTFNDFKKERAITFFSVAVLAFAVEVSGVMTGKIFGLYSYGNNLGPKWLGVPLIIGLNWSALLLIAQQIVTHLLNVNKRIYSALLVATLMTVFDLLLELIAPQLDYWSFTHKTYAPIQNFIAWWLVSFIFALATFQYFRNKNRPAIIYGIVQVCFFVILEFALMS
jgi:bisanhydrobacterioruberin hydratase